MSDRVPWLGAILVLSLYVSGCGLMKPAKNVARESVKPFKLRPNDYRDTTNESDDEWTSVGRTASTVRGVEKDEDPLRNVLLSPKARSIERNLGIE